MRLPMQNMKPVEMLANQGWIWPTAAEDALENNLRCDCPNRSPRIEQRHSRPRAELTAGDQPDPASEQKDQSRHHHESEGAQSNLEPNPEFRVADMPFQKLGKRAIDVAYAQSDRSNAEDQR